MALEAGINGFPGLYRPGLIEASTTRIEERGILIGFRGFTAPASLKLQC